MPFIAPLLRTTLLLSSLTLAASYALYENNEGFRNFVDNIVDKILAAWDHVLATLSPEEQRRQREAQRREVLVALTTRGNASGVRSVIGQTSGADANSNGNNAAARRRNLWQIAQRNAAALGQGIDALASDLEQRSGRPDTLYSNMRSSQQDTSSSSSNESAPDPPEMAPDDGVCTRDEESAEVLVPIRIESDGHTSTTTTTATNTIPVTTFNSRNSNSNDDDDTISISGTSTISTASSYSRILTPTSSGGQEGDESDGWGFTSAAEDPFSASSTAQEDLSPTVDAASRRSSGSSGSVRSASTETMSRFTQSAPPSVARDDDDDDDDDMSSRWSELSSGGDDLEARSVSDVDSEMDDPLVSEGVARGR